MDTDGIIGFGSAILAFVGAVASGVLASRANRQAHELDRRRRLDTRLEDAERVLGQYRDPLLDAAQTLQSRLFNIIRLDYLARYLHCGDPDEERYARDYTVYAIAEYLCWVEIVRRELRFLDLGDVERNRQLLAHLTQAQVTIQSDAMPPQFRIFRGRQRAIAELTMVATGATDGPRTECVGYAAFSERLHGDPAFAAWFARLSEDVDTVAAAGVEENIRLVRLQNDLVDLIEFLDPGAVRIIPAQRQRLPITLPSAAPSSAPSSAPSTAPSSAPSSAI